MNSQLDCAPKLPLYMYMPSYRCLQVTKNWVTSSEPLGTPVTVTGCAVDCVSAGTTVHEETPYKSFNQVFEFIEKKFQDTSPGNL